MDLDTPLTIKRFMTLAKTADARLEGEAICGKFSDFRPLAITSAKEICEDFANWLDTPKEILRFTRKYAPPHLPAELGQPFQFEISKWIAYRRAFRADWQGLTPAAGVIQQMAGRPKQVRLGQNPTMWIYPEGVALQAQSLLTLLYLCLAAFPSERLRVCPAPKCVAPYFVAHHLKQTFCGTESCIEWGKNKLKLEYWNRNKERLLAERKRRK